MNKITNFLKGFIQNVESPIQHDVEIRPYFDGVLHTIVDFRRVIICCYLLYMCEKMTNVKPLVKQVEWKERNCHYLQQ